MDDIVLLPPNLSKLGVVDKVPGDRPDLITIWDTPYPVLTDYKIWCNRMEIKPFAGGNYINQGPESEEGYITSGYRVGSNNSAHLFGLAIDVFIPELNRQIEGASYIHSLFTRVGIYPHHKIVHLDLASKKWMMKFGGRRFWVCEKIVKGGKEDRKYTSFDDLNRAIIFAREVA